MNASRFSIEQNYTLQNRNSESTSFTQSKSHHFSWSANFFYDSVPNDMRHWPREKKHHSHCIVLDSIDPWKSSIHSVGWRTEKKLLCKFKQVKIGRVNDLSVYLFIPYRPIRFRIWWLIFMVTQKSTVQKIMKRVEKKKLSRKIDTVNNLVNVVKWCLNVKIHAFGPSKSANG